MSSLQRWSIRLLVGFTDPYNHTYSESLWWKLFKNHQRTQIQRQRQWQRQRQRQRHRKSAWNTHLMLYFWNPDDSLIPNMMIDTSPWSSCSRRSAVTLVTLIQSYIQFYRAECNTVSGFFLFLWTPWHQKWDHRVCILQTMSICNGYWILHSQASGCSVWSSLHIFSDTLTETRWLLGCSNVNLVLIFFGDALGNLSKTT